MARFLETQRSVAPLGLRFRDAATESVVGEGLEVRVRRADGIGSDVQAFQTRDGMYALARLPGRGHEWFADGRPSPDPHHIIVRDRRRRYVPALIEADLPSGDGWLPVFGEHPNENSAPTQDPNWYLFSSATRTPTLGLTVVRADLVDAGTGEPAAHAVLEVRENGFTAYGVADAGGRVAVHFPYPDIELAELSDEDDTSGGPPGRRPVRLGPGGGAGPAASRPRPLRTRTWDLQIRIRYHPADRPVVVGIGLPLLTDVIQQSNGTLYADDPPASASRTLDATLTYGEPCVLRTTSRSVLLVDPASG